MYPEKLSFDGLSLRTAGINEAVRLIYSQDKDFGLNKNRTNENKSPLSCLVGVTEQISNLFIDDLIPIGDFSVNRR